MSYKFCKAIITAILLLCAKPAIAGYTFINGVGAGSSTGGTVSTTSVNMTGADLLIAEATYYGVSGTCSGVTMSDSSSNTWTAGTAWKDYITSPTMIVKFFYVQSPTVSASQTFTLTGASCFQDINVLGFSGSVVGPHDQETGTGSNNVTVNSQQPGSITPTQNNELIITGFGGEDELPTVSAGYTIPSGLAQANVGGQHFSGGIAYKIQTTAAAENPTWSWTTNGLAVANITSFEASSGGGGGSTTQPCVRALGLFGKCLDAK